MIKIILLLLEVLGTCFVVFIFFINRYDKQITSIALNVMFIGFTFTFLSYLLSPTDTRYGFNRIFGIVTAIFLVTFLSAMLAFIVNLENKEESNNFYIYFVYDEAKNQLVNIGNDNNHDWFRKVVYFNNFVSKDKNNTESMKADVNFFKDFLDFLVIRNIGSRYNSSWLIHFDRMPLTGISTWGPKDYKLPVKTKSITESDIVGYEKNSLINKVKDSQMDEEIKAPDNTYIFLEKGVKTDLLPNMDMDKEMKSRTRRFVVKNDYCTINIDTCFEGLLAGNLLKGIKNDIVTSSADKCGIQIFAFKAKYKIEYDRFKMGTKKFIDYYKPWARDLCNSFQAVFDIQNCRR